MTLTKFVMQPTIHVPHSLVACIYEYFPHLLSSDTDVGTYSAFCRNFQDLEPQF
jgi:hypothetical protein